MGFWLGKYEFFALKVKQLGSKRKVIFHINVLGAYKNILPRHNMYFE